MHPPWYHPCEHIPQWLLNGVFPIILQVLVFLGFLKNHSRHAAPAVLAPQHGKGYLASLILTPYCMAQKYPFPGRYGDTILKIDQFRKHGRRKKKAPIFTISRGYVAIGAYTHTTGCAWVSFLPTSRLNRGVTFCSRSHLRKKMFTLSKCFLSSVKNWVKKDFFY